MDTNQTMRRITGYFGGDGKPYNAEVSSEITKLLDRLSDGERDQVFNRLVEEERANFKIGVKELVAACQFLGVVYHAARKFAAVEWSCDACQRIFRYYPVTDHDDHLAGQFDACPRCGFQPHWTMTREAYAEKGMLSEAYEKEYTRLVEHHRAKFAPPSDPFWSPSKDGDAVGRFNAQKAARIAATMQLLGNKVIHREPKPGSRWDTIREQA
ncbi:hypothetical protein CCP3SC15_2750008 [Gammaproteobacteria bacterium]